MIACNTTQKFSFFPPFSNSSRLTPKKPYPDFIFFSYMILCKKTGSTGGGFLTCPFLEKDSTSTDFILAAVLI